ncbi:MAG: hypothetical protein K1X28_06980 [Parachlamydiales bacterium]|nr:hypothetical protein [Parachlamydiales bacterium]
MMEKAVRFIQKEPSLWGPIFLLCTVTLAARIGVPYDLLLLAAGGFFLSARMQIRGCCYALVLLGLVAILRHAFLVTDHLWSLGLESSLGIAFFITALAFEQESAWIQTLESQIETRKSALENLEEEMAKVQEHAQSQQIAFQEKAATLQKELEDLQSDHSSILILNEVLRKTTARHMQEAASFEEKLYEAKREIDQLKVEYRECEEEISRIKNNDEVVSQNIQLMKELNQARYDKEQTHLINETLARLHAKEVFKAKDAETETESLKGMLQAAHQEIRRIEEPLKQQAAEAKRLAEGFKFEFEKANKEANRAREELLKLHEIQAERNFLKERLDAAMLELAGQKHRVDPQMAEKLKFAEEKMLHLSQIEPLFKQLKQQFEDKTKVLQQARTDLFKTDTELQKLKIEKSALEMNPIPKEVEVELQELANRVEALEEENGELQELVSVLTNDSPERRKKKLKTSPASPDQTLLF